MPSSTGFAPSFSSTPDRVGRDGALAVAFERRGGRTVLTERRFTLPLQALEPLSLDGGAACLVLLNPTGGVVGGDRLTAAIRLGPGAHVVVTTPSATRVYRTSGPPAILETRIRLEAGALLEYVPDHLIPHPGSVLRQSLGVELGPESLAIVLDAFAVGRLARGELWEFAELASRITVTAEGRPLFIDRLGLDPGGRAPAGLGGMEGFGYLATLGLFGAGARAWEEAVAALEERLSGLPSVRGGATLLARGGCVARFLAPSAADLAAAVRALWARARRLVLGLPALDLRKA